MTAGKWTRLSIRESGRAEEFEALVSGVPAWLEQPLIDWLNDTYLLEDDEDDIFREQKVPIRTSIRNLQMNLRLTGIEWNDDWEAYYSLLDCLRSDGEALLDAVDYVLNEGRPRAHAISELRNRLYASGSAWTVGPDGRSLTRRVLAEAQASAQEAIARGDRETEYLCAAWRYAYGRNPQPGSAYRDAVRAIEAVICPLVIPNDSVGTLGKAIAVLRDAPAGKFGSIFDDNPRGTPPVDLIRGILELVWTNQIDRHGTANSEVPINVSQEQAEAAVQIAVLILQWVRSGVLFPVF